ncbi:MAG: hypothetical protein JRI38_05895 [Deltaproteobacteria bacterium]|nr:hypothetical protein [Deltaproteobacteria bacterium]
MRIRTCVTPDGSFVFGIHRPKYQVLNLRESHFSEIIGTLANGSSLLNTANFPDGPVKENSAVYIYEIPNPFPFRGTTYIGKTWADKNAENTSGIGLPPRPDVSMSKVIEQWANSDHADSKDAGKFILSLPEPLLLALAANSTDPRDLEIMADACCEFVRDPQTGRPNGLPYHSGENSRPRPLIKNRLLFETLANNYFIPDDYKKVMVLKPGVQGTSKIVGEVKRPDTESHVFEYLRSNSYIPWGHYAANMAHDSVRYRIEDLSMADMKGLRHLYYQRTFVRLACELGLEESSFTGMLTENKLEEIRISILDKLALNPETRLKFNATLWGWNFGFDYSPSKYRLHASHQQIHHQFAMVPADVQIGSGDTECGQDFPSYACGDLVRKFIREYRKETGTDFFNAYTRAIFTNCRMDGNDNRESSLIVYQDKNIILFVPKAQTSQWELQLMPLVPVGNIIEADTRVRNSLDTGLLTAIKALSALGARMVTVIEYAKRFDDNENGQRLLYSFLPRLPQSPGAFSEAQLRWINGHYPEDFAAACRDGLRRSKSTNL